MKKFIQPQYQDSYSVKCPAGISIHDFLLAFFSATPQFIKTLMQIRNTVVTHFGLKTEQTLKQIDHSILKQGNKIGFFEVGEITQNTAVIGADDSHLNFRIILTLNENIVNCTTQVIFNNWFGHIYFFFVKPFHKFIAPAMLNSAIHFIEKKIIKNASMPKKQFLSQICLFRFS